MSGFPTTTAKGICHYESSGMCLGTAYLTYIYMIYSHVGRSGARVDIVTSLVCCTSSKKKKTSSWEVPYYASAANRVPHTGKVPTCLLPYLILHTQCHLLYGPGVHSPFRLFQDSSRAYVEAPGGMEAQDLHHPPETGLETTAVSRRASERGWLSHLVEAA